MAYLHLPADGGKEEDFNDEIEPRHHEEQTEIERECATVESEDVGILHQGEATFSERFPDFFGNVGRRGSELQAEMGFESLECRCTAFLSMGVTGVEEHVEFHDETVFPLHVVVVVEQGGIVVEFATVLSLDKPKVNVAVVVCQLALSAMASKSADGSQQPYPYSKSAVGDMGNGVAATHYLVDSER